MDYIFKKIILWVCFFTSKLRWNHLIRWEIGRRGTRSRLVIQVFNSSSWLFFCFLFWKIHKCLLWVRYKKNTSHLRSEWFTDRKTELCSLWTIYFIVTRYFFCGLMKQFMPWLCCIYAGDGCCTMTKEECVKRLHIHFLYIYIYNNYCLFFSFHPWNG